MFRNESLLQHIGKFIFIKESETVKKYKFLGFSKKWTHVVKDVNKIDGFHFIFTNQWVRLKNRKWYSIVFNADAMHTARFANVPILLDYYWIKFSIVEYIATTYIHV